MTYSFLSLRLILLFDESELSLELTPESLIELLSGDPEEIEVHLQHVEHTFEVAGIKFVLIVFVYKSMGKAKCNQRRL